MIKSRSLKFFNFFKYFKFNKKAATEAVLVSIILAIIGFISLAMVIGTAIEKGDDLALENACKSSIDTRAATVIWAKNSFLEGKINLLPPMCVTVDKKLKGDREDIIKDVADLSARCWWMFGQGKYEEILADNPDRFAEMVGVDKHGNDCFICYTLLMDEDDFGVEGDITSGEILQYMYENQYPKSTNYTYLEYIQNSGGPGAFAMLLTDDGLTLDEASSTISKLEPRHAYAVVYLAKNKAVEDNEIGYGLWKIGGAAVGTIALGACIIYTAGVCGVGVAGGILTGGAIAGLSISGVSDLTEALYSERDVSAIYIDDLQSAQNKCFEGDLAGN